MGFLFFRVFGFLRSTAAKNEHELPCYSVNVDKCEHPPAFIPIEHRRTHTHKIRQGSSIDDTHIKKIDNIFSVEGTTNKLWTARSLLYIEADACK